MAKLTLNTIGSRYGSVEALNDNFDAIEQALENTFSLDGTSPNALEADLDMNNNDILNAGVVNTETLRINGVLVEPTTGLTAGAAFQTYEFTATAGQTSFSVSPATPYNASIVVIVNGLQLSPAEVSVSGTNVITPALTLGDEVVIRRYTAEPVAAPDATEVNFIQAGIGAVTRTVQSKLRESISVKDFGAIGDGIADDSTPIQNALNSGNTNILIPVGTYKITSGHLIIPSTVKHIYGDGIGVTILTTSKNQTGSEVADSLLYTVGNHGLVIEDLTISYTGTFDTGSSYSGTVSGLWLLGCNNLLVQRVEALGWNNIGMYISGGDNQTITECYTHHNRVCGIGIGSSSGVRVLNNFSAFNGLVTDGGTGYGIAVFSGTSSSNVLIAHNRTYKNFRKGIDVHDGYNFIISDNQCTYDRLYGISIENDSTVLNNLVLENNQIFVDPSYYVNVNPYQYYYGIAVYINPYSNVTANTSEPIIAIRNNTIFNIGTDNPTWDACVGIYLTTINSGNINSSINNNKITGSFASYPIIVNIGGTTTSAVTEVSGNTVEVSSVFTSLLSYATSSNANTFVATENTFNVSTFSGTNYIIYGTGAVSSNGNIVNGLPIVLPMSRTSGGVSGSTGIRTLTNTLVASTLKSLTRLGQQGEVGHYNVQWSAYRRTTGPSVTHVAAGEFKVIAGWDSVNGQTPFSAIFGATTTSAGTLTITWALNSNLVDNQFWTLDATASHDCTIYVKIESILALDLTLTARKTTIL